MNSINFTSVDNVQNWVKQTNNCNELMKNTQYKHQITTSNNILYGCWPMNSQNN